MATTSIDGERRSVVPIAFAAAVLLIAAVIGGFAILRPDVGLGGPSEARLFTLDDAVAIVAAPATTGELVLYEFAGDEVGIDPLHLVLGNSFGVESAGLIEGAMRTGITESEIAMHDRVSSSGDPAPIRSAGGASFTVLAATYADAAAADAAFDAFLQGYDTWTFAAPRETWDHGDEGALYPYSLPERAHGRCYIISSLDPCAQELRVWRQGNLIVTVLQEGDAGPTATEVVALIDGQTR